MPQENHHRRSIRLQDYDYSQAGAYFITICALDKAMIFGEVADAVVTLSQSGLIVSDWWHKIPMRFHSVELDEYVVMPNHFHGILLFRDSPANPRGGLVSALSPDHETANLSRRGLVSTPKSQFGKRRFDPHRPLLGEIMAYFKYLTTKKINVLTRTPGRKIWQRSYHERVIRNERDLAEKRQYIADNPLRWELDEYFEKMGKSKGEET